MKRSSFSVTIFCSLLSICGFSQIVEVETLEAFEKELKEPSKQVFVQFCASWCSPCRYILSEEKYWNEKVDSSVKLIIIDIQKIPELCRKYDITGVPMLSMMDAQGNVLVSKTGSKEISKLIASYEKSLTSNQLCLSEFVSKTKESVR